MDKVRAYAVAGTLSFGASPFLPLISLSIFGTKSLADGPIQDSYDIFALTAISLVLIAFKKYKFLLVIGLISFCLVVYQFGPLLRILLEQQGPFKPKPDWGWFFLLGGPVLMMHSAHLTRKPRTETPVPTSQ